MEHNNTVRNVPTVGTDAPVYKPCFDLRYFHGNFGVQLNEPFLKLLNDAVDRSKFKNASLDEFDTVCQTVLNGSKHVESKNGHFVLTKLGSNYSLVTTREFGVDLLESVEKSAGREGLEASLYVLTEKLEDRLYPRQNQRPRQNQSRFGVDRD